MLIDCPTCSRCYQVDQPKLGPGGRMVICPRCQTRWFAGDRSHESSRGELQRLIGVDSPFTVEADPSRSKVVKRRRRPGSLAPAAAMAAIVLAASAVLVAGREGVVLLAPQAAPLYAAAGLKVHSRGLDFAAVATARRDAASSDVIISGEIRNRAKHRLAVPRLVYEVRDQSGASLARWTETAPARTIPSGRTLEFSSSPHHLSPDSRSVMVTFESDEAPSRSRFSTFAAPRSAVTQTAGTAG